MSLYGLRLLVALLTFAVGVAAAWVFSSKSCEAPTPRETTRLGTLMPVAPSEKAHPSCRSTRTVEGGILLKKTINESSDAYPHYAKVARVSGGLVVKVEVDEDGRVVKAQARGGFGMLPEAAEKDALETRFPPTRIDGRPVRVTGCIMYNYVLD